MEPPSYQKSILLDKLVRPDGTLNLGRSNQVRVVTTTLADPSPISATSRPESTATVQTLPLEQPPINMVTTSSADPSTVATVVAPQAAPTTVASRTATVDRMSTSFQILQSMFGNKSTMRLTSPPITCLNKSHKAQSSPASLGDVHRPGKAPMVEFPPLPARPHSTSGPSTAVKSPNPAPKSASSLPSSGPRLAQTRTYREAVSSQWSKQVDVTFAASTKSCLSSFQGEPALFITEEEEQVLAQPFIYTLVGKFTKERPPMVAIRKEILAAKFQGTCGVGLLDYRHIILKFELEVDFHRMWIKKEWSFNGFQARIFRWTKDFCPEREPSITPVWVKFPLLPLHLINKDKLFPLGSAVGAPLKLDLPSAAGQRVLRPSEARICVEVDVLKKPPSRVWIGSKEKGCWQEIELENVPEYCLDCQRLGHSTVNCKRNTTSIPPAKKIWLPKSKVATVESTDEGKAMPQQHSDQNIVGKEGGERCCTTTSPSQDLTKGHSVVELPSDIPLLEGWQEPAAAQDANNYTPSPVEAQQELEKALEGSTYTQEDTPGLQLVLYNPTRTREASLSAISKEFSEEEQRLIHDLQNHSAGPSSLPRTESAPLLRLHWLDKAKPKPELPVMVPYGNVLNVEKRDNIEVQVQFEEQVSGQVPQIQTRGKTNRYNLRSLSKEEIYKKQSSRKKKKIEARRNALEFCYSDFDTHIEDW